MTLLAVDNVHQRFGALQVLNAVTVAVPHPADVITLTTTTATATAIRR